MSRIGAGGVARSTEIPRTNNETGVIPNTPLPTPGVGVTREALSKSPGANRLQSKLMATMQGKKATGSTPSPSQQALPDEPPDGFALPSPLLRPSSPDAPPPMRRRRDSDDDDSSSTTTDDDDDDTPRQMTPPETPRMAPASSPRQSPVMGPRESPRISAAQDVSTSAIAALRTSLLRHRAQVGNELARLESGLENKLSQTDDQDLRRELREEFQPQIDALGEIHTQQTQQLANLEALHGQGGLPTPPQSPTLSPHPDITELKAANDVHKQMVKLFEEQKQLLQTIKLLKAEIDAINLEARMEEKGRKAALHLVN